MRRLRDDTIPKATPEGAVVHIGGANATFIDLSDRVMNALPWFIGAVVLLSFLLLMVVFRSILAPLKAAVLNLLSIGASYGVIVAIFQWGGPKPVGHIGHESSFSSVVRPRSRRSTERVGTRLGNASP